MVFKGGDGKYISVIYKGGGRKVRIYSRTDRMTDRMTDTQKYI